jgi:hypothetical protein
MFVCSDIYFSLLEAKQDRIALEFVRNGYDRAMTILSPMFDQMLTEIRDSSKAHTVLNRITRKEHIYSKKENSAEIKRAVDYLVQKSIIARNGHGSYRFVEPVFADYILRFSA